jgi:hypothetical protein
MGAACNTFWWGDLTRREQLEDKGVDVRIILTWIFKKWDGEARTGLLIEFRCVF